MSQLPTRHTQLYLCLATIDGHVARDCTAAFLPSLRSEWLPAQTWACA